MLPCVSSICVSQVLGSRCVKRPHFDSVLGYGHLQQQLMKSLGAHKPETVRICIKPNTSMYTPKREVFF